MPLGDFRDFPFPPQQSQNRQLACKPGSVWLRCMHRNVAAIHLGRCLHIASCNPPG